MTIVDRVFEALGGYSGVMNEKLWRWLGDQGHTQGTLSKRIASYGGWNEVMKAILSGVVGILSPENVTAEPISSTEITTTWEWSGDEQDIDGFNVEYRAVGDPSWTALPDELPASRSVTITGLTPDTDYEARVRAFDAEDASAWVGASVGTPEDLSAAQQLEYDFSNDTNIYADASQSPVVADGGIGLVTNIGESF